MRDNVCNLSISSGTLYARSAYYSDFVQFEGNAFNLESQTGTVYNYLYYSVDYQYLDNEINIEAATSGTVYGIYAYSSTSYPKGVIAGNRLRVSSGSGTCYGLYGYYPTEVDIYNNVVDVKSSGSSYALYLRYSQDSRLFNNSFHDRSTNGSSYAGYVYNSSSSYSLMMRKSLFSKLGSSGYVFYTYKGSYQNSDYNNYHDASGGNLFYQATPSLTTSSLASWRASTGQDRNSLNHDPGFMSPVDLRPDPSNPAAWSLNGRGDHIPGNTKDILGNARVDKRTDGVPDIGAYESSPTSVPSAAVPIPANPSAGTSQVFLFGQDTVARVDWPSASPVPGSITVRQYSGVRAPGLCALSGNQMYFYMDLSIPSGTYVHDLGVYYKDPWRGTTNTESDPGMAQKDGGNPWQAYMAPATATDSVRNLIYHQGTNRFGYHTGIDGGNNASVAEILNPQVPFRSGNQPLSVLVANIGSNVIQSLQINWSVDGLIQPAVTYSTPIQTLGSGLGNQATVNLGNVVFGGAARTIKVWTSMPNATADLYNGDDTVEISVAPAMNGTYTVGGSSPDFSSIGAAITALHQKGVCGPVVIHIRNGTYTERNEIQDIAGASSINTVTFQSETKQAGNVIIRSTNRSSTCYIFRLAGAKHIQFKDLSLQSLSSRYGRLFWFQDSASHNLVESCQLVVKSTNSTSTNNASVFMSTDYMGRDNHFVGNEFQNGAMGFYIYGSASHRHRDIFIEGNSFSNPYYRGIYAYYTEGLKIKNNRIDRSSVSTWYGIYVYEGDYGLEVRNNEINSTTTSTHYPFYFSYCDGIQRDPDKMNKYIGNKVNAKVSSSGNLYIYHNYCHNDSFAYNEFKLDTRTGYVYLYLNQYNSHIQFIENDIDVYNTSGYAVYNDYGQYTSNSLFSKNKVKLV